MVFEFAGQTVAPGSTEWIDVSVTHDADMRTLDIPTCVVHGSHEGPTLWLQGCIHGPEQVGPYAIRTLLDEISPEETSGTIVAVPVVNQTAFASKQRESPLDKKDLNRNFPGTPDGTYSDALAHRVFTLAAEHADYVVDMHTGGNEFMIPGYSIFPLGADGVESETRELCRATDLPYAVGISTEDLGGAMYAQLAERGIPSIITETGGEGRLHEEHVANAVTAIRNVTRHLDVLEGAPDRSVDPSFHEGLDILTSDSGGFFELDVEINEPVDEGVEMASVTDLRGNVQETIEAPYDAIVVAARTYAIARPGDWVFELTPQ
jgi:predicted deacylase